MCCLNIPCFINHILNEPAYNYWSTGESIITECFPNFDCGNQFFTLILHEMLTGRIYIFLNWMSWYILYNTYNCSTLEEFFFFIPVCISLQRLQGDLERSAVINRGLASRVAQCSLNGLADFLYRWENSSWHISYNSWLDLTFDFMLLFCRIHTLFTFNILDFCQ